MFKQLSINKLIRFKSDIGWGLVMLVKGKRQ